MEEQLISFETSKLAKSKGLTYEDVGQSYRSNGDFTYGKNDDEFYPAPTQSLLQKWLREKHLIDIIIGSNIIGYNLILWDRKTNKRHNIKSNLFQHYEEALEAGSYEALKLIK